MKKPQKPAATYRYDVYEVIDGREVQYGSAPTRYKARKVAKELRGAKIRRVLAR